VEITAGGGGSGLAVSAWLGPTPTVGGQVVPVSDADLEYAWFFRAEFPGVLQTVFLILQDRGRSEDVTQEAFIELFVHWRKVSRYERPEAWVRRVAIWKAVRALRRERMRAVLERDAVPDAGLDVPDVDLARGVRKLPVMQRSAVVLFYFEDRPVSEIAFILGISAGAVKVHLHRARRRLAELLGEEVDENAR
jgi:RNA polymerase sigma factor (sigma-70 family)